MGTNTAPQVRKVAGSHEVPRIWKDQTYGEAHFQMYIPSTVLPALRLEVGERERVEGWRPLGPKGFWGKL